MSVTAKRFEFRASLAEDGTIRGEGEQALAPDAGWSPEALLLAGLVRCVLASLRFYAKDAQVRGAASAWCLVTLREDGRFAIVETTAELQIAIDPEPPSDRLPTLLARAEAGCFIGNSLTAKPTYSWIVNGHPLQATP